MRDTLSAEPSDMIVRGKALDRCKINWQTGIVLYLRIILLGTLECCIHRLLICLFIGVLGRSECYGHYAPIDFLRRLVKEIHENSIFNARSYTKISNATSYKMNLLKSDKKL